MACRPSHAVAARTRSGLTASVPSTTSQPGTSSPPTPRRAQEGSARRRADAVGASVRLHSRQAHPAGGQTTRRHSGDRGRPRWANHLVCPGQLVRYSIIALAQALGVVDYVRRLEEALIAVMTRVGVANAGRVDGRSGVSLPAKGGRPERKIAAIGGRVDGGVTLHGFAPSCSPRSHLPSERSRALTGSPLPVVDHRCRVAPALPVGLHLLHPTLR